MTLLSLYLPNSLLLKDGPGINSSWASATLNPLSTSPIKCRHCHRSLCPWCLGADLKGSELTDMQWGCIRECWVFYNFFSETRGSRARAFSHLLKNAGPKCGPYSAGFLLLPSPQAEPSATESNCFPIMNSQWIHHRIPHMTVICFNLSLHMWGLVTWAVTCIQHIPGSWQPEWKGRGSDAWVISVFCPETNQSCMPHLQHLGPRQGRISLARRRERIHSRQAMIFKNTCSLQWMRGGFLAHVWPTRRQASHFPCVFSSL